METVNKEILLDYLFSELETDEARSIDKELLRSSSLRKDLAEIQKILGKVSLLDEETEPPRGLRQRTLDRVFAEVGGENLLSGDDALCDSPAVPDEVILFPLIKNEVYKDEEYAGNRLLLSSPSRLSRRTAPLVSRNTLPKPPLAKPETAEHNITRISKRRYTGLLISAAAAGVLLALFIFPLVHFAGGQIQAYITQSRIHQINKNLDIYAQLVGTNTLQHTQPAGNPAENSVSAAETAHTDLAAANWQEVVPAKVPLLNVGSNSGITVLPADNERILPNNSRSTVYLMSSPVFQDTGINVSHNTTLTAQNPPDILYLGQMPEKIEQLELNHRDLDYQTLMSKINGTVSLMNEKKQSNPTVQTVTGQNVLLQNGKVFFRELPVFLPQGQ